MTTTDDPSNFNSYSLHQSWFRKILAGFLKMLLQRIIKYEIEGLERIPTSGAAILASNSSTNFDIFLLQSIMTRPIFFLTKSDMHKNILLDSILRNLGILPENQDFQASMHARKILEHNQILVIFPEGIHKKRRGLRAGKTDAARMAIQMNCPIIPVSVVGNQNLIQSIPKRTKIRIVIGHPIYQNKTTQS